MSEVYDLAAEMRRWPRLVRLLATTIVASGLASLAVLGVEAALGQMTGNRLETFATTWLWVGLAGLAISLLFVQGRLLIGLPIAALWGWYWWWSKLASKGLDEVMPLLPKGVFVLHYPLCLMLTLFVALQIDRSVQGPDR